MKKSNILSGKMISVCLALACVVSMAFMTSCGSPPAENTSESSAQQNGFSDETSTEDIELVPVPNTDEEKQQIMLEQTRDRLVEMIGSMDGIEEAAVDIQENSDGALQAGISITMQEGIEWTNEREENIRALVTASLPEIAQVEITLPKDSQPQTASTPAEPAESGPAPDSPSASSEPPASNKNTTESAQEYQVLEQNAEALEKYLRDNLSPEDHGGIYLEKWGLGKDGGIFLYVWTVDDSALDSTLAAYTGESFPVERLDARCSMAQLSQLKEDLDSIAADENAQIVHAVSETGNLVSITVSGTDFDRISSDIRQAASKLQIPDECVIINKPLSENPVT